MIIHDMGLDEAAGEGVMDEAMGLAEGAMGEAEGPMDDGESEPTSIIVTNLQLQIFEDEAQKSNFEAMFHEFDDSSSFQYFKSFRRVRVNLSTHAQAAAARLRLHMTELHGEVVKCYFTQPIILGGSHDGPHLQPPKRDKQFLISPPASPPVGWEPVEESEPVINYDLIAAVASLAPGERHELHPAVEDKPGIFVHICEDAEYDEENGPRQRIPQTRRPNLPA